MTLHTKIISAILALASISLGSTDAFGKTGILMAHYGTRNDASRHATIDYLDSVVSRTFPNCEVVVLSSRPAACAAENSLALPLVAVVSARP